MKTRIFYFVLLVLSGLSGYSQQDPQYTQYMYNTININPAYAGNRGVLSVFGLHRTQWVGLDGAPVTNAFSINTPFNDSNVGLGISFANDRIGPAVENNLSVDFSYTIPMDDEYKLSFGLKGTANLLDVDYTKLKRFDVTDAAFQYNIDNRFSPNVGAGLFLHKGDRFYAGISVPNILETRHYDDNDPYTEAKERMHFYLIGGYVFDLGDNIKFKPAFLTKMVQGAPLQLDVTANFMFNNRFVLGAAWRWSAAVSGLAGFQVSDRWFIGYAYDAETTKLANYNSGSHEIFLRYEFVEKKKSIVTPRFF